MNIGRSLFSVIVAVIAGLAIARFIEAGASTLLNENTQSIDALQNYSASFQLSLLAGWFIAAFFATAIALLLGRRWAPLGIVSAATVAFSAIITMISFPLSVWLWPASLIATAIGGFAALKILRAKSILERTPQERLFED